MLPILKNMINTILGTKKEMSARFDGQGHRVPVTPILAEPNIVLSVKDNKAQLGFGKKKHPKKPQQYFVKVAGFAPRYIREVKTAGDVQTGNQVTVTIFSPGDEVKVTGTTKGRGFAGVVKRWGFAGGPKTHGQSDRHRAPGSIGQTTTPGRVYRGKHMAGHMGVAKLTVTGLEVVDVDPEKNLLIIKGAVPGHKNSLVIIEKTGKVKTHIRQPEVPKDQKEPKESKPEKQKADQQVKLQDLSVDQKYKSEKEKVNA